MEQQELAVLPRSLVIYNDAMPLPRESTPSHGPLLIHVVIGVQVRVNCRRILSVSSSVYSVGCLLKAL